MTPAARYASAIAVLDDVLAGSSAEKCLTSWARANRYAGSKDRAAVRDHVFDVLRRKRSLAALGGGMSGRSLILGLLRHQGIDHKEIFGVGGYAPHALTVEELGGGDATVAPAVANDLPDWLWPMWEADLGDRAVRSAQALQDRGPVTLRVNLRRGTCEAAIAKLQEDGIISIPIGNLKTALQVIENERRIHLSNAFLDGLVDLQDLASQEAIAVLDLSPDARVLDYCAGGGGKALAIADMYGCSVTAHDISVARMTDIPLRAARAKVEIVALNTDALGDVEPFDVVFVDAPCSGSGTWRRAPEAKWSISSEKLCDYSKLQREVLENAAAMMRPNGRIIYATCSVLKAENSRVVGRFVKDFPEWKLVSDHQRHPDQFGDGFYYADIHRA